MSRVTATLIAAGLVFAAPPVWGQADYVSDEVIVRFASGVVTFPDDFAGTLPIDQVGFGDSGFQSVLLAEGVVSFTTLCPEWRNIEDEPQYDLWGDEIELIPFTDVYVLKLSAPADIRDLVGRLEEFDEVIHAEPNLLLDYGRSASRSLDDCPTPGDPNDEYFPQTVDFIGQWGLVNPGDYPGATYDVDVDADSAWCFEPYAVKNVGVTDSGSDHDHPDLVANLNLRLERGFLPPNYDTEDEFAYDQGHGTACAGIVAAVTNNEEIGVAALTHVTSPRATRDSIIVTLKVAFLIVPLLNAISYAASTGEIPILSTSLVPCKELWEVWELRNAVRNAYKVGLVMVAAAGNDEGCGNNYDANCIPCTPHREGGGDVYDLRFTFPAAFDRFVFGVGAIKPDGSRYMNWAAGKHLDITAPGDFIVTTRIDGGYWGVGGNPFFWGTSASTPLVAGAASLLQTFQPALKNEDVVHILETTAHDLGIPGPDDLWGAGLMKVDDALRFIAPPERVIKWGTATGFDESVLHEEGRVQCFRNVEGLTAPSTEEFDEFEADVYAMRKWVPFQNLYGDVPTSDRVWVRGRLMQGWPDSLKYDALLDVGYGEVVPGSITASGCWLRTYTYHVFCNGEDQGWYPFNPAGPWPDPLRWDYTYVLDTTGARSIVGGASGLGSERRSHAYLAYDGNGAEVKFVLRPGEVGARVEVFDVAGRRVRVLTEVQSTPGVIRVRWDGRDEAGAEVPVGIYFYRLRVGAHEETAKLLLLRRSGI